jgi:hypothetical protein
MRRTAVVVPSSQDFKALNTRIYQAGNRVTSYSAGGRNKETNNRLLNSPGVVWTTGVSSGDRSRHGAT